MNIMVSFNDAYAFPTKVMLKSLILNNPEELYIYVVYTELSNESINSLKQLEDGKRIFVSMVPVNGHFLDELPLTGHFTKETFMRLFAQTILDESIDRILWLDGDVIVNRSISSFYNMDFEDSIYIGERKVQDANIEKKMSLNMPKDSAYINAGVLLINLKAARRKIDDRKIIDYILNHKEVLSLLDQDVINGYLNSYVKATNTAGLNNFFVNEMTHRNKDYVYKNARILHYVGVRKPWKSGYRFFGFRLWWKYAEYAEKRNKITYYTMIPSCLYGKMEHIGGLFLREHFYFVYKTILDRRKRKNL
uniref:LPS:glycosyltransferase n=1 Tax=Eubacterium cellulosolvens (strain ATCC 43171 / JCM 9499 / 6) TaxID=633697 RepID=I5AQ89_EUBC6